MPLPIPRLDDRTFQNIVDEAKTRLRTLQPAWTDHNVSDPGVTLIELFAWMTEMLIYRLNRVPERQYIALLQLLGIELEPPQPARAQVTFQLTRPVAAGAQQEPVVLEGTEITTIPTAQNPTVITFAVEQDQFVTHPGEPRVFRKRPTQTSAIELQKNTEMLMFGLEQAAKPEDRKPAEGDCIYFGFQAPIATYTLRLDLTFGTPKPSNYAQATPPIEWQVWSKVGAQGQWATIQSGRDMTGGLINDGTLDLYIPANLPDTVTIPSELVGTQAPALYYIRCVYKPEVTSQGSGNPNIYDPAPKLKQIKVLVSGLTAVAAHAERVLGEQLGVSDGRPSQRFKLAYTPVLELQPGKAIEVETGQATGAWEPWTLVKSFESSKEHDKHVQIDYVAGEICFGPNIRSADGTACQHGQIPPRGARVRVSQYRYGGGVAGNVAAHTLTVLKRALPYVITETDNYLPASGGRDPETLEQAMLRARQSIRVGEHAVTREDFERLARKADPERVARAHCVEDVGTRTVKVLLVRRPNKEDIPERKPIAKDKLLPTKQAHDLDDGPLKRVQQYLDERRMLTTTVEIDSPRFVEVAVKVGVRVRPQFDQQAVRQEVERRLYRFLNPLTGGNLGGGDSEGWAFGRGVYPLDILMLLQGMQEIELIDQLSFTMSIWELDPNNPDPSARWKQIPLRVDPKKRPGTRATAQHAQKAAQEQAVQTVITTQGPIKVASNDIVISGKHIII